jgi:hypothetical protein
MISVNKSQKHGASPITHYYPKTWCVSYYLRPLLPSSPITFLLPYVPYYLRRLRARALSAPSYRAHR